ncbi:MAG: DNA cytosine methyltransferase, partial [Flavobacteriales bacterium]|nr:DNA cytosine methyltransferase [Flavobacteriales bacterium]
MPGYVLIENVPGIAQVKGNSTYKRFPQTLTENGYKVRRKLLWMRNIWRASEPPS